MQGLSKSALIVMALAALAAVLIKGAKPASRDRIRLSAVSVGPGEVLPPESVEEVFACALVFWRTGLRYKTAGSAATAYWWRAPSRSAPG